MVKSGRCGQLNRFSPDLGGGVGDALRGVRN
jgi:hypothetical protein